MTLYSIRDTWCKRWSWYICRLWILQGRELLLIMMKTVSPHKGWKGFQARSAVKGVSWISRRPKLKQDQEIRPAGTRLLFSSRERFNWVLPPSAENGALLCDNSFLILKIRPWAKSSSAWQLVLFVRNWFNRLSLHTACQSWLGHVLSRTGPLTFSKEEQVGWGTLWCK